MFKKFMFAVAPMVLVASSVLAGDDMLSTIANLDGANDPAAVEDADTLGQADVDALLGDDDDKNGEEAVAACFRRGYGHSYGSSGGYNSYNSYNNCGYSSFSSYCSPSYSYNYCYPVRQCYTPVYSYCAPVSYSCYSPCYTSYWGCW